MSENNSRRSPLCETCGDFAIKDGKIKILVFIFIILCIGIIGLFYIMDLMANMRITFLIIMFSFIIMGLFGYYLIGKVVEKEK